MGVARSDTTSSHTASIQRNNHPRKIVLEQPPRSLPPNVGSPERPPMCFDRGALLRLGKRVPADHAGAFFPRVAVF